MYCKHFKDNHCNYFSKKVKFEFCENKCEFNTESEINEEDICPKCGNQLEGGYVKLNDNGGYNFDLGLELDCTVCDFNTIIG